LDGLLVTATQDLAGLRKLLARDYDINSTLEDLKRSIKRQGQERWQQRQEEETSRVEEPAAAKFSQSIALPAKLTSAAELDALIQQLRTLRAALILCSEVDIRIMVKNEPA
jgi:FKBP-type peptidyl-prolyl cis-trans isomerase (trigger factor)